jgi:hypothetical protein
MLKMKISILSTALAVALGAVNLPAQAQAPKTEPTTMEKVERAGQNAVKATGNGAKRAWKATQRGSKKVWGATKHGAKVVSRSVNKAGSATAGAIRNTGNKIGEHIPGTVQHDAKNPKP